MMRKIDAVYLWVDGNDPKWARAKDKWLKKVQGKQGSTVKVKDAAGKARWRDNGELLYSLRSLAECAPWINHIFIITGFGQVPPWLNTRHPKITLVPHEQIIPADALPTFNSTTIEMCIPNIPGLSEHFLLINDDMMFNKRLSPDFFYDQRGRARVLYARHHGMRRNIDAWIRASDAYTQSLILSAQFIERAYGKKIYAPRPSHGIDPYLKSSWETCMSHPLIRPHVDKQIRNKFRTPWDIQRWTVNLFDLVHGRATFHRARAAKGTRHWMSDWIYNTIHARAIRRSPLYATDVATIQRVLKYAPMFCINDDNANTVKILRRNAAFLAARFPNKCEFEK